MKFKVGDHIALREDPEETGSVETVWSDSDWVVVEWDSEFGDKLTSLPSEDLILESK